MIKAKKNFKINFDEQIMKINENEKSEILLIYSENIFTFY